MPGSFATLPRRVNSTPLQRAITRGKMLMSGHVGFVVV
jgi:hypothetical protein